MFSEESGLPRYNVKSKPKRCGILMCLLMLGEIKQRGGNWLE
jgi:hypothetical protein